MPASMSDVDMQNTRAFSRSQSFTQRKSSLRCAGQSDVLRCMQSISAGPFCLARADNCSGVEEISAKTGHKPDSLSMATVLV